VQIVISKKERDDQSVNSPPLSKECILRIRMALFLFIRSEMLDMKKAITLLLICLCIILSGCHYSTLNEAIQKDTSYKVNNVLHIEKLEDISLVLYDTLPNQEEFPYLTKPVLGVAFFEESDEDGWKNIGPNGWQHQEDDYFTTYSDFFKKYDNEGNLIADLHVVFGEINNQEITKIVTLEQGDQKKARDAVVIETDYARYYLATGQITNMKGLSKKGEIIHQIERDIK
jgi:hypothetical protein